MLGPSSGVKLSSETILFVKLLYTNIRLGNLYQKFEIEKYTVNGKLILPKKIERHLKKKNLHELACEFAWICEYLQASCIQHFNPLQPAKKILNFYLRFLGYVHTCTKLPPINGFHCISIFSSIFLPKTPRQLFNASAVLPEVPIFLFCVFLDINR